MDSLTQFVLGASVGEAVLGKKIGRKAMLWGGICGTIPDLDVFIPMGNAIADFTYHRSFSHSIFFLALLTPLVAWLAMKIHKQSKELQRHWWLMVYLVFFTHVLLDCFTAYGTQIFWPFIQTPVSLSSVFIIDPVYTLSLIIGLIGALIIKGQQSHLWNVWGLGLSTLYLGWSITVKVHVDQQMHTGLQAQGVGDYTLFTTPTPFNTLLWRGVAKTSTGYYEVFYSLLDENPPAKSDFYQSEEGLLDNIENQWSVSRLVWFTKGFYRVSSINDKVVITDLRMGGEPYYAFQFVVAKLGDGEPISTDVERLESQRDLSGLNKVWQRIWSEDS